MIDKIIKEIEERYFETYEALAEVLRMQQPGMSIPGEWSV